MEGKMNVWGESPQQRWLVWKERILMQHLWKENEKLKQHFYKLIQVTIIETTKRNKQNSTHRSEMKKSDRKSGKRGENKNSLRKRNDNSTEGSLIWRIL